MVAEKKACNAKQFCKRAAVGTRGARLASTMPILGCRWMACKYMTLAGSSRGDLIEPYLSQKSKNPVLLLSTLQLLLVLLRTQPVQKHISILRMHWKWKRVPSLKRYYLRSLFICKEWLLYYYKMGECHEKVLSPSVFEVDFDLPNCNAFTSGPNSWNLGTMSMFRPSQEADEKVPALHWPHDSTQWPTFQSRSINSQASFPIQPLPQFVSFLVRQCFSQRIVCFLQTLMLKAESSNCCNAKWSVRTFCHGCICNLALRPIWRFEPHVAFCDIWILYINQKHACEMSWTAWSCIFTLVFVLTSSSCYLHVAGTMVFCTIHEGCSEVVCPVSSNHRSASILSVPSERLMALPLAALTSHWSSTSCRL